MTLSRRSSTRDKYRKIRSNVSGPLQAIEEEDINKNQEQRPYRLNL